MEYLHDFRKDVAITEAEREQILNEFRRKIDEEAFRKREELKKQKHNLTQVFKKKISLQNSLLQPFFFIGKLC